MLLGSPLVRGQEPAAPEPSLQAPAGPVPAVLGPEPAPEKAVNFNAIYGAVVPRNVPYVPLTWKQRGQLFVLGSLWNPSVPFRALGGAVGDQFGNNPPEWKQGMKGYSRRVANRFGRFTLQDGMEGMMSGIAGYETRYIFSKSTNPWTRAGHAMSMYFVTYDKHGHWVPHWPRVGTTFAAEFIGNQWYPKSQRDIGETVSGVVLQIAFASAFNLVKEFSPEWKRVFRKKNRSVPPAPVPASTPASGFSRNLSLSAR